MNRESSSRRCVQGRSMAQMVSRVLPRNGVASNLQGSGRKARVAGRTAAPQAYGTLDRTIGVDATLSRGPLKAGKREQVLDNEATRLLSTHFCGSWRHG